MIERNAFLTRSKKAILMDLFGRTKKPVDTGSIKKERVQIKTPEQIQKEAAQNELDQIKKEIQESLITLNTASSQLENLKNEYDLITNELAKSKTELESNEIEFSKLK